MWNRQMCHANGTQGSSTVTWEQDFVKGCRRGTSPCQPSGTWGKVLMTLQDERQRAVPSSPVTARGRFTQIIANKRSQM